MFKRYLALICCLVVSQAQALDLKQAITEAEKTDPVLRSAMATRDANDAGISIARAKLLPYVEGQGAYSRTNQRTNQDNPLLGQVSNSYKTNATSSQIYFKQALVRLSDWTGLTISQAQLDYTTYKLAASYSDLWVRVSSAWVDVVSSQNQLEAQLESEKSMTFVATQAQKSYEAGIATKDAALEAHAQLALIKANVVEAKLSLASRQRAFQLLTNQDPQLIRQRRLPEITKLQRVTHQSLTFLEKTLLIAPELQAARLGQEIRELQLKQISQGHYPTVDLVGSTTRTNNNNVNQIGMQVTSSAVGVQVTIPIYYGGGVRAQEQQAAAYLDAAKADLRATELRIKTDVDAYWATQDTQIEKTIANHQSVEASKDQVRAYRMGVKAGLRSWSDVGNAEVQLSRRQNEYINSLNTFYKAQIRLLSYLPISDDTWDLWVARVSMETAKK